MSDWGLRKILTVDRASRARTIFVESGLNRHEGLLMDAPNNRLLVADSNTLWAIDLTSAAMTVISASGTPDSVNPFSIASDVALDGTGDRLFVANSGMGAIHLVNPDAGDRVIFSK